MENFKSGPARQTVIITGGNSGIGYQCARYMAASGQGWHIVVACRDQAKAEIALEKLRHETGYSAIEAMTLDLASLASVRAFAGAFVERDLPPLRALVCNAGLQIPQGTTYTEDGFETTFGVNHLGHFLLVNLLLPHLSAPARIVITSSGTHDPETLEGKTGRATYQDANWLAWPEQADSPALTGLQRYTTSKLCNMLCAYELARRLEAQGYNTPESSITVNAFDPGAVPGTRLTRGHNFFVRLAYCAAFFLKLFGVHIYRASTAGKAQARLVLDPKLEGVSGKYFRGFKEATSSKDSYDRAKAADLWEKSAELVKLNAYETALHSLKP